MKILLTALSLSLFSTLAYSGKKETCFKIDKMSCNGCAKKITAALLKQKGVDSCETSFDKKETRIKHDAEQISSKDIVNVIQKLGDYKASEQKCSS